MELINHKNAETYVLLVVKKVNFYACLNCHANLIRPWRFPLTNENSNILKQSLMLSFWEIKVKPNQNLICWVTSLTWKDAETWKKEKVNKTLLSSQECKICNNDGPPSQLTQT